MVDDIVGGNVLCILLWKSCNVRKKKFLLTIHLYELLSIIVIIYYRFIDILI